MSTVPGASSATSSAVGLPTRTTASAPARSSLRATTSAPAASYSASGKPACAPAPCSTPIAKPAPTSRPTESGTSATRRSPAAVSFGTATLTETQLYASEEGNGHPLWKPSGVGSLLATFSAALEARDPYLRGHSARVTAFAEALAVALGWTGKRLEALRLGGSLHDVGKISVDAGASQARSADRRGVRPDPAHPVAGARLVECFDDFLAARPVRAPPPRALGRDRLPAPPRGRRDPARGAPARRRGRVRRDDVGPSVPPGALGRGGARRAGALCGLAVRPLARLHVRRSLGARRDRAGRRARRHRDLPRARTRPRASASCGGSPRR